MEASSREQIIEVVHKLFIYTDERQWQKLQEEVFNEEVLFDMSSMTGESPGILASSVICQNWEEGFKNVDAVNHLCGNLLVNINGERANVFAYATATHYKANASLGKSRDMVGTYNLHLVRYGKSWKIDSFKYNLKYIIGNADLS